jgi:hypothetical protein
VLFYTCVKISAISSTDHPPSDACDFLGRDDIDDFFFEELRGQRGILIDPAILDGIVDDVLASARVRLAQ